MIRVRHTSVLVMILLVALLGGCAVESEEPTNEPSADELVEATTAAPNSDGEEETAEQPGETETDLVDVVRDERSIDTSKLWNRGGPYPIPWQAKKASALPPNPSAPDDGR